MGGIFIVELITFIGAIFGLLGTGVWMRRNGQAVWDSERRIFNVMFPVELTEKQLHAFIRSIGSNLSGGSTWGGVPTVVFEILSSPQGIIHRLRLPKDASAYLTGQLQNAIPGIELTDITSTAAADYGYQFGATVHMANAAEEMPLVDAVDYSHRIIASMQDAIQPQDSMVLQWVIAHSNNQKMPPSDSPVQSNRTGFMGLLLGNPAAGKDEVKSRRKKQHDQNYLAIGRIGARSESIKRSESLVHQVVRALTSEGGHAHLYARKAKPSLISEDIRLASTPLHLTAQFDVRELAAVMAWPVGGAYVPRMMRGSTRHMPASETVPRDGRILGLSTMPGSQRQIAMSYEAAASHLFISGSTGVGKTVLMTNTIKQDMERGAGIVLIERDGNLFRKALDQVPPERTGDVICIDFTNTNRPVGLNLLKTNRPEIVAGQLTTLFDALYPDSKSMYASQLVQQGIPVLANLDRATIADLIPLVHPRNPVEKAWAMDAVERMPDKTYRDFWESWYKKLGTKELETNAQPLKNRLWEILTPEPTRYLLNQETSSFNAEDVIKGNKLLFVNLAGVSEQVASLIGTMLVTVLWTAAKRVSPNKPNFMYLDEFQQFSYLSGDFEDMLATARKRNLGLVMATQYIERLSRPLQDAVMANARTKVIFQSSAGSSRTHAEDFAHGHVKKDDFMNLRAHMALARINTDTGVSPPITLKTVPEPSGHGLGRQILSNSALTYGRDVAVIRHNDETRRQILLDVKEDKPRKNIGVMDD